jgi:hypothetical protein
MTCQIYDNSLFKKITIAITFQHCKILVLFTNQKNKKKQLKTELPFPQNKNKTKFLYAVLLCNEKENQQHHGHNKHSVN